MKQFFRLLSVTIVLTACSQQAMKVEPVPSSELRASMKPEALVDIRTMPPEEMMRKIKEAGTPGEGHRLMEPLVGAWSTESKWWKDPAAAPEMTKGTSTSRWILGKRFIEEDYRGKFMGQAFEGMGILGYDNVKKKYVSAWSDSMGTGIMVGEGNYNPAGRTLEISSRYSCPITETERQTRLETRIVDNNTHIMEMYDTAPDGTEYKSMEVVYRRKI